MRQRRICAGGTPAACADGRVGRNRAVPPEDLRRGWRRARRGHFSDNAVYVQDAWRPVSRLTITPGLRIDRIGRTDDLFNVELQKSTEIGPRLGVTYVLTSDQRNVAGIVHATSTRQREPVVSQWCRDPGSGRAPSGYTDYYDMDSDGTLETSISTRGTTAVSTRVMAADYHQPFVDEWTAGYRRQLPGGISLDAGFIHRDFRDRTALVQHNGIYDGNRFLGYQNGALSEVFLVTNNRWNWPVYDAFEISGAKRSDRLQILGSYTRAWSHLAGTWQPYDPASFIQPEAFAFARGLPNNDNRTASLNNGYGPAVPPPWSGPEWSDHVANLAVAGRAPWNILVAASYGAEGLLVRSNFDDADLIRPAVRGPFYHAPERRFSTESPGDEVPFAYSTRSEGQVVLPARHHLNLRVGREFRLRGDRRLELDLDIFNVPNLAGFQSLPGRGATEGPDLGQGAICAATAHYSVESALLVLKPAPSASWRFSRWRRSVLPGAGIAAATPLHSSHSNDPPRWQPHRGLRDRQPARRRRHG